MKAILLASFALLSFANGEVFNAVVAGRTSENANFPADNPTSYLGPPIEVPSGALFTLLANTGPLNIEAQITVAGVSAFSGFIPDSQRRDGDRDWGYPSCIAGPATIRFVGDSGGGASIISYSIEGAHAESSKSNAAIIPDDHSGDHQVILEASTDLKTWVPVQPGSYPSTAPRRFFRVRIQKQ